MFANSPKPPYYAVIFSSLLADKERGYAAMAEHMMELAAEQDGFLGVESARDADGFGLTVSYWRDEQAISDWKHNLDHLQAQAMGRRQWYRQYSVRVVRVEREYGFPVGDG